MYSGSCNIVCKLPPEQYSITITVLLDIIYKKYSFFKMVEYRVVEWRLTSSGKYFKHIQNDSILMMNDD